jgi:D-3-phosphoglycerate dehydrogenase
VVSRGQIVEEEPLIEALRSGHVAGAGLDVFAQEPLPADSPLWDAPNVLISPHISADSSQMWERRKQICKDNLRRYLAGEQLVYVCDKKAGF